MCSLGRRGRQSSAQPRRRTPSRSQGRTEARENASRTLLAELAVSHKIGAARRIQLCFKGGVPQTEILKLLERRGPGTNNLAGPMTLIDFQNDDLESSEKRNTIKLSEAQKFTGVTKYGSHIMQFKKVKKRLPCPPTRRTHIMLLLLLKCASPERLMGQASKCWHCYL